MIELNVPGWGMLTLKHLVLDLNGTIALDGQVLPGVAERLNLLSASLNTYLISADTRGCGSETAERLGLDLVKVSSGAEVIQKRQFIEQMDARYVVAIGNGANDREMLETAALGIAVLGNEGVATASITAADILVSSIQDALDLLLYPRRLVATLRC